MRTMSKVWTIISTVSHLLAIAFSILIVFSKFGRYCRDSESASLGVLAIEGRWTILMIILKGLHLGGQWYTRHQLYALAQGMEQDGEMNESNESDSGNFHYSTFGRVKKTKKPNKNRSKNSSALKPNFTSGLRESDDESRD